MSSRPSLRTFDPFAAPYRWLLRLGLRFYYPVALVGITLIIAIVVRDMFSADPFRRRLVILAMIAAACVFILFWRAEHLWQRGQRGWLVTLARPDLVLWWAGLGVLMIGLGLAIVTRFFGAGGPIDNLWLLLLFPLLYLAERGSLSAFALVTAMAGLGLAGLRFAAGDALPEIVLPPLWLALLAASNMYLTNRYIVLERRAELLRDIANELSNTPDVDAALDELVAALARRLRYDRLRVWLAQGGEPLRLRAAWGLAPAPGLAGIAERVWQTRRLERWDDIAQCAYAGPPLSLTGLRAAVTAPILAEGKPVGVLEALSPRLGEFWEFDEEQLSQMADSIGLALARSRAVQREAARLRDTLAEVVSRLGDCTSLAEMFAVIAQDARTRLNADAVVLYQLAPGTGYPLTPPLRAYKDADRAQTAEPAALDPALFEWLNHWEPDYRGAAGAPPLFAPDAVQSTIFLPLGTRTERAAALFINFYSPRSFSPLEKLTLEAFASLAAEQVNRERATWRKYEAFGGVLFGVHGPLTLSADALRRLIGSAQAALVTGETATATAALDQAQTVTRRLEIAAMLTRLARRDAEEDACLQDDVRRAAQKIIPFAEAPAGRERASLRVDIPPEADDLPFAVQDALYCLALEGVANASFHGGATQIEVSLAVAATELRLTVADNGRGFVVAAARPGPHGIFEGLTLVQAQFAARGQIDSAPGQGARVVISFPLLR